MRTRLFSPAKFVALLAPLASCLAGLAAATPLMRPGFFDGHDGIAHLFRVAVLADEIRRGAFYPRWASDLALGYGYPVFHFYGPAAHYLAWFASLFGLALPEAVKLIYGLALVVSALGMYALARRAIAPAGPWGAALAAAAYSLAPYFLDDVYVRGAFGEAIGFAWYPFLLIGIRQLAVETDNTTATWQVAGHGIFRRAFLTVARPGLAMTAVSAALAVVTYNPLALLGLPLAGLYGVWLAPKRVGLFGFGLALGLALSSWFWLPAMVDASVVTIGNLGYAKANFLEPGQLVQASIEFHHEWFPFSIGGAQFLLTVGGVAGMLRFPRFARREPLFFLIAGVVATCLMSTPFAFLWEFAPLLKLIAYPWRLLAFVALCWAPIVGCLPGLVGGASSPKWSALAALAGGIAFGSASLSTTLPDPIPLVGSDITPQTWLRREQDRGIIGTTTSAEYLPRWSAAGPGAAAAVPRGDPDPGIRSVQLIRASNSGIVLSVDAVRPTDLRLHQFYFPGWKAWVDDQEIQLAPATALGLVSAEVPAGIHLVAFRFSDTTEVLLANILTVAATLGLVVVVVRGRRRAAVAIAASLLAAAAAILAGQAAGQSAFGPSSAELGPGINVLGASVASRTNDLVVRSLWLARIPPTSEYQVAYELISESGVIVARRAAPPRYGTEATNEWRSNELIADQIRFRLPTSRSAGVYRLDLAMLDGHREIGRRTLAMLRLPEQESHPEPRPLVTFGGQVALDGTTISLASEAEPSIAAQPGHRFDTVAPGTELRLRLDWRALQVPDEDYVVFVHLLDPSGKRVGQVDRRPAGDVSAMTTWEPGDVLKDEYRLTLPIDSVPGAYRFDVGLYTPGGSPRLPVDSTDDTTTWTAARLVVAGTVGEPEVRVDALFGGWATLRGYDYHRGRNEVRLVWLTNQADTGSFSVFVHALDESGRIVAQSDGPPAGGAFPTELWPPGRLVEDRRSFPDTDGVVRLRVGLYDAATGRRLTGPQGDSVDLKLR